MVSDHVIPVSVQIPTSGIMAGAAHWPLTDIPESYSIFAVKGYLRVLTTGTFTVTVRDMKDPSNLLISTLDWTSAGDVSGVFSSGNESGYVLKGTGAGLRFSVPSIGIGALDCIVTVLGRYRY